MLENAPRTIRGARDLLSVALQYGNAFLQGLQAAALKPADFFGNDDVLYLMEDMATGEIRLSILWEWLHKGASLTADDAEIGVKAGDTFTRELFEKLLEQEYDKLQKAGNRDVHDVSKRTTLPIAREIAQTYVMDDVKLPWYIDLLNINLNNSDLDEAKRRIRLLADAFAKDGTRITENLDFAWCRTISCPIPTHRSYSLSAVRTESSLGRGWSPGIRSGPRPSHRLRAVRICACVTRFDHSSDSSFRSLIPARCSRRRRRLAAAATLTAQYSLTVNKDRLINAANEPQNWLLMNGDYGSLRYSKLTQINRENVKNLRMVWAMALGGMQDVGQNGPENEINPLIDNGFMYTSDGWGTIYKIDARDPNRGKFAWVADPGVPHEGNTTRTRGIALWEDKVLANLPDGRVIAINRENGEIIWDKKITTKNEFGNQERFLTAPLVADGKVLVQNGAGDGGTRGWVAALDVNTGNELWRWYTVPKPGDPGSETWKDDHNAWKTGGGGIWQTGSYDAAQNLYIFGTGNPFPIYDPQFRPGDNLYTNSVVALNVATGKMAWYFQYTPNDSWDYDEAGVFMLYDTTINGRMRKVVGHYARNGFFYSVDRTNGRFIAAEKYVNDLNWTKGIDPETGKPVEYSPKLDVQIYNPEARSLRGDPQEAHLPDLARRRRASADGLQPGEEDRLRRRHRGLLLAERRRGRRAVQGWRRGQQGQPAAAVQQRSLLRLADRVRRGESQGAGQGGDRDRDSIGRAGDRRRPGVHGAAGRLDRRLQRRDARGAVALQRRHAAQGCAGHLFDRTEAVSCRAGRRPAPASGELGQAAELELPVRLRVELTARPQDVPYDP